MRRNRLLVVGLLLLILSPVLLIGPPEKSAAANTVLWKEVDPPATGETFVSQVCGDVNEDGHLDLIGGTWGAGVWVAAGNGDGSWTSLSAVTASGVYSGLALGDVNRDGKLDLVGAEEGSGIHIWTGDGAGGWTTMAPPTGSGKHWSVALGDVNGDGKLDIAAGSAEDDGVEVWTGDGTGGWTPASTGLPATGDYPHLALGDVDRDGRTDLVAAGDGAGVRAWRGGGSWTEYSGGLPTTGDYYGVGLGDLDRDGDLDIFASGDGVGLGAWTGSGGPFWSWSDASTGLPGSAQFWHIGLGDVDNDGDLDVAAASHGGGVWVWTGDGAGTWSQESTGLPDTGAYYGLALGDLNDDGMLDLSAGHSAGMQAWFDVGTPDPLGGWMQIPSPTTSGAYQGLDVGDWNHDGKLDVVAASAGRGIHLWKGDGGNTWAEISGWTDPDLPRGGDYTGVALGDIDHNGWLDVVAGSGEDNGLHAWLFVDAVAWIEASPELPESGTYLDIDLGDLNNDGHLDIAAAGSKRGVRAWTAEDFDGDSSGWWDWAGFGLPTTGTFLGVAFGDLNDDGRLDLVAGSEGAGLSVWQGDCTGNWTAAASPTTSATWRGVAVGDLNDDGQLDLVAASAGLGVRAWAGDGGFGWTALAAPAADGDYTHVALDDLNNDGKLDVAAGWGKDAGLQVWAGDGGTSWTAFSLNLPASGIYPDVAFGEIDNDGILDLVGARYGAGSVHAWTGAEGAPPSGWDNFLPTGWITKAQTSDVSIQVRDTGSGLDVSSAVFACTGDAGVWSAWEPASCSGSDGVTTVQTIDAAHVKFNQDSGPWPHDRNRVRFRISDMAGNVGYSGEHAVKIDTTPPANPTIFDTSHWPGVWESDDTVDVDWDGASDETSGVAGYSYVFSTTYELPDATRDTWASAATSDHLPDGEWYISVRTRDDAGNWAPDAAQDGPYRIDTGPPTNPTGFDSDHEVGVWSSDDTIYIDWWGAGDAGSGVWGYGLAWTELPTSMPGAVVDTTDTFAISEELHDSGSWYFHIRTADHADNWASDARHWGPFYIDTTDPFWCEITLPAESNSSSFRVAWYCADGLSGIDCYDVQARDGSAPWTTWQTCTTDTSAMYTGGQNTHTYYFRVRAHDRAGNVSPYLAEDHTHVLLPPGVSGFTPASGFASAGQDSPPLQLVRGSEVVITGSALTGGTATFNGVAMDPALSKVVSDGEIRAVIGAGTPTGRGPVCVETSVGESCSADTFEVLRPPFPMRWGLGFDNFSTPRSGMTWGIFERAFGRCQVNFCGSLFLGVPLPCRLCPDWGLVRRPDAIAFFEASRGIAKNGDCYGISYLTLDFHAGAKDPEDYAAGADIPASLTFEASRLARDIRVRQWRQLSLEALSTMATQIILYETAGPVGMLAWTRDWLAGGNRLVLCMSDLSEFAGHCVNAYEVVGDRIHVYDNNLPYINNNHPQDDPPDCTRHDYLDQAMERFVDVDPSHWSYPAPACEPGWAGDWPGSYFMSIPYAVVAGPHHPPTDILGLDVLFWGQGAGRSSVEDGAGGVIGYDASGQFTRTITSAIPIIPYQDGPPPFEGYYLPEPGDYTVHVSGTASGAYSMTIFAQGGTGFVLQDVPLGADTRDAVAFRQGGGSTASLAAPAGESAFVITTSDAGKPLSATLLRPRNGGSEQRTVTLDDLAIGNGTPLTVTSGNGGDSLIVGGGAGSTYDICFYQAADAHVPAEFCWSALSLQAGDRHVLTPDDWDHLSSTRVRLEVDESSDGTIDETYWLVGHGLALTMEGQPAIVASGDRITYTLAYAITGEEVAPGAVLTTIVPLSTTFVSASGGVTPTGDVLNWPLGDLTPPTAGQAAFTVQIEDVPGDVLVGTLATLRDESGRWAMASSLSAGPDFALGRVYLPVILRNGAS